jgi:two-component system sensor kinase FixL
MNISLFRWFRKLTTPLLFQEEEKTRAAGILNAFSLSTIVFLILIICLRLLPGTENDLVSLPILFSIVVLLAIGQVLMRAGHVRGAAIFLVTFTWIALTVEAWQASGVHDIAVIAYILIILLASLLLGWVEAVVVTILSIISLWFFAYLEHNKIADFATEQPYNIAQDLTIIFVLSAVFIYLAISSLRQSLKMAHLELLERLRAEEKLQRQTQYLTALHETTLGLIDHLEVRPLLESILTRACELINTSHGLLEMVLPDSSALFQELGYGIFAQFNGMLTYKGSGATGNVWASGKTIVVQNYREWENNIPEYASAGFHTVMGVPLKSGPVVIGVLALAHTEASKIFTLEQQTLLERFAALASVALDNARLYEQVQKELQKRLNTEFALQSSEERFRKVFHANPVAMLVSSLEEERIIEANDAYWKLTGLYSQTSIGQTALELGLWDSKQERKSFIDQIKLDHSIYNPDNQFTNKRGEVKSIHAFYELVKLGNMDCLLSILYDITEQKEAREAVQKSEARMRALLNAVPDMIFEFSESGVLLDFIPSTDFSPHIPPEQFLGKNIEVLFPASVVGQTMFALERALGSGQLHAFEYELPAGNETHHYEARLSPSGNDRALAIIRDITLRKWAETERESLIRELENKNTELERFTYTVSHDLKSPLITIKGFLGFLEKDANNGNTNRLKTDIQRISDAVGKMQRLLNELLELSRIGRLKNEPVIIPFDVLAREALELVDGNIRAHKVKVEIQKGMSDVYGDHQRLLEVVQNLLDNATKFMGKQPDPRVDIGQRGEENGMPVFFVRDNGIGIPPEHFERIFGLFNKLDITTDGTGVGLAIVKRIIEIHGGRIWVESEAKMGSTFYFTLAKYQA